MEQGKANINYQRQTNTILNRVVKLMTDNGWNLTKDSSKARNELGAYSWEQKFNGENIVLWTKGTEITDLWRKDGNVAIKIQKYKCRVREDVLQWTTKFLEKITAQDLVTCSDCGKLITREEIGGSHFAGNYCQKCWEDYKKENSRRCRICGAPMYRCHC